MSATIVTVEQVKAAIEAAEKHLGKGSMVTSARSCIDEAKRLLSEGKIDFALQWSVDSLLYSVGIFHADTASYGKLSTRHAHRFVTKAAS